MDNAKYIGMDVRKETISIAVLNSSGKLAMESVIETRASTIVQFVQGLRGELHVTLEEGTWAAWLYDLLRPHVTEVLVCDPRKNALLKVGSKSDRIDARKLAESLRSNLLRPVYHGEHGVRTLKELSRSYMTISGDLARVMTRLKAVYRRWAIPSAGKQVYAPRDRAQWLGKISEAGVRRRAGFYYQQLDELRSLRQQARRELLAESGKHKASNLLGEKTQTAVPDCATNRSSWKGRPEPSLLIHTGWKVRKYPVAGEVFFLTSPFIELLRTWPCSAEYKRLIIGYLAYCDGLVSNPIVLRLLRKCLFFAAIGIGVLVFLVVRASQVEQRFFRSQTELLLSHVQSLELRKTPWPEAQR